MKNQFSEKKILVTGGTGSIGSEIVRQLLPLQPEVIRIFSRDETRQFFMQQELRDYDNLRFLIGDIRDKERVDMAMQEIDIVFHAAALKHVPSCEYNPFEAIKTNVNGTQNLIKSAIENKVEKVISISTDKSVNPINVMGATKLLMERLIVSANYSMGKHKTKFACVRFGNVLGSRGSLLDLFKDQIKKGHVVTVTNPDMTRFFMSVSDAVGLMFKTTELMIGGEIFILKMPSAKLGNFVKIAVEEIVANSDRKQQKIQIERIGIRPGEKMHEELMTTDEASRAKELEAMYIILPMITEPFMEKQYKYPGEKQFAGLPYQSNNQDLMTNEQIRLMIRSANLI